MSKVENREQSHNGNGSAEFPTPYLGRSVKIVGEHVNVDMNQSPHPKNQRGELGKPLFNWYRNTVSKDPLTRVSAPNHFADRRHFDNVNRSSTAKSIRAGASRTRAMTRHIQGGCSYLGPMSSALPRRIRLICTPAVVTFKMAQQKTLSSRTLPRIWCGDSPLSSKRRRRGITTSFRRTAIKSATPHTTFLR